MKQPVLRYVLPIVFLMVALHGSAQNFTSTYSFGSVGTGTGLTDPTPVPNAIGVTFGSFIAVGQTVANPNAGGRFSFTGQPLGATNGSDVFTGTISLTQYYQVTIAPQPNFNLNINSFTFTSQRSPTGIRRYAVRSSLDGFATNLPASINPANSLLSIVGVDTFQVSDAAASANVGSTITLTNHVALTSPVTFRFYGWDAEAAGGTFSIDDVTFNGSTTAVAGAPALTVSRDTIAFPSTAFNTSIGASYTISGINLSAPVSIAVAAPYMVSEDSITFVSALSIPAANVATPKKIFVKFSPTAATAYNGTIANTTTGGNPKNIVLTGSGIDSTTLAFDFNTCTNAGAPGSGFTTFSVTGAQFWSCTTFGSSGTNGVNMNGYSGSALTNEDWLISPPLKFGTLNLPVLSFLSRGEFGGPSLELLISTDYTGTGNPNSATWTALNANFPESSTNIWTLSDNINLSNYKAFPKAYIAFKYISSPTLGAARWTLDSINITNRTSLLSVSPAIINFPETSAGNFSVGQPITFQAQGYGGVTFTAPTNFQVSLNNTVFSSSVLIPQATAEAGTTLYVRFAPSVKALTLSGQLVLTGTGLNQPKVNLSGSSYPKSETFDVACYNMSFFGSNSTNTATQAAINLQVANIATVYQRLNVDIIGFEEMSNDVALDSLRAKLPGYASVTSNRWSYSFDPPDPTFPPQKVGFIYNTATTTLVSSRVMFEAFYDSIRAGTNHRIDDYPTGTPSSFWSSGRLPFMATFNTTINGITKQIRMIVIHAKALGDQDGYTRRRYDAKLLKDSLDVFYPNDIVVMVGDYNDRMVTSTYTGSSISPFIPFLNTPADTVLTYALDAAGTSSFVGSGGGAGMIDHIMVSNELAPFYIAGSTAIEPANVYISPYTATTASDHLPVFSRFAFDAALPVTLLKFDAKPIGSKVEASWSTASEQNTSYFIVERSNDGRNFSSIGRVQAAGNSSVTTRYALQDFTPTKGANYYRLQQVDANGRSTTSATVLVWFNDTKTATLQVYPNPVTDYIKINSASLATDLTAKVIAADGRVVIQAHGDVASINKQLDSQIASLKPAMYILQLGNASEKSTLKFIKQ